MYELSICVLPPAWLVSSLCGLAALASYCEFLPKSPRCWYGWGIKSRPGCKYIRCGGGKMTKSTLFFFSLFCPRWWPGVHAMTSIPQETGRTAAPGAARGSSHPLHAAGPEHSRGSRGFRFAKTRLHPRSGYNSNIPKTACGTFPCPEKDSSWRSLSRRLAIKQ